MKHRDPIPAPFSKGTKLRYVGAEPLHGLVPHVYVSPGDEVIVDHHHDGERGGQQVADPLNDWGLHWVESETRDGCSTIVFDPVPGDYGHLVDGKRIFTIQENDRDKWEIVP